MDRLPRGRHGLSPEFVARNQRERLIAGLTQALYEVGYQKTTVSLIGQKAAVSKSDFYKHFESKDDCFVAAYDAAIERIREQVVAACDAATGKEWPDRVRRAVAALLTCSRRSRLGEHRPGRRPARRPRRLRPLSGRGRVLRRRPARGRAPGPRRAVEVPEATDEAVVGGIASMLGRRILAGEVESLTELFRRSSSSSWPPTWARRRRGE